MHCSTAGKDALDGQCDLATCTVCVMMLTNEGAGKKGEPNSQWSNVAVPGLSHRHSIDGGHQYKGHDQLPQEQLARSNGDSSLVSEATRHAVPATHMHRGNQDCLQTTTQCLYVLAA